MKQIMIVALTTFALSACLDREVSFQIVGNVLVYQEVTTTPSGESDVDTTYNYVPYVIVGSNDAMLSCSCTHSSLGNISLSKLDDTHWHSSFPTGEQTDAIPTGNFAITATSANDKVAASTITVTTLTRGMTNRLESTLVYDRATREVTAGFNALVNADLYGIALIRRDYFWVTDVEVYTAEQLQELNNSIRVVLPEAIDAYAEGEFYLVAYAANLGDVPVVQLGARTTVGE